ncbi:MAG: hypothetical protein WA854_12515 [Candidatus Binataceae bacterium]
MIVPKFRISLADALARFIDDYSKTRGLNRSQAFAEAVKLLRSRELEAAYRDAGSELDNAWESTIADGLADETR